MDGMTYQQVADLLSQTDGCKRNVWYVRRVERRALKKIRELLEKNPDLRAGMLSLLGDNALFYQRGAAQSVNKKTSTFWDYVCNGEISTLC